MRWHFRLTVCLALLTVSAAAATPAPGVVNIHVKETAGIRRFGYPANARVPFPKGTLPDAMHVRLMFNRAETPAQFTVESKWPDGSVQWLGADFNASLAPHQDATFQLEYGEGVKPEITPKGLKVTESADAIQVGDMRFSKSAAPLLQSVKYREEAIGQGPNGFAIIDNEGVSHDATSIDSLKFELLRRGPVYVVFRYSGRMRVDSGYRVPFSLTIEMPNSKSWWKGTATVEDPAERVREIAFHTPLALGPFPWIWDLGIGSWTYGTLQKSTDSLILSQFVKRPGSQWQILTGLKGREEPYEITGLNRPPIAEGWGHIQNQQEAVAFAVEGFGRQEGKYTIAIDGSGQAAFTFAPARPQIHHQFILYQHFVAPPAAIGAVTNPASMLNPPAVFCEREQYLRSRLPVPPPPVSAKAD